MQQIAPEGNNPVLNEETLLNIIKSIKNLESLLKDMKSSILTSVESKLQEMKTTLVSAFDNSKTYSEAVQKSPIVIDTSSADEGYFNNTTDTTADANSSQTIPKTVYPIVRRTTSTERQIPTPKHIPVHVSDRHTATIERRNTGSQDRPRQLNFNKNSVPSSAASSKKRTLLIGDSILNPINPKGIERGILKHSKSGAKISNVVDDIGTYNLKSFDAVVVSVGGNDASSKTDIELFEEKYDQFISIVKAENPDCELYLCYISPRGDTDVRNYNECISQLGKYWEKHKVTLITETETFFYGKDELPTSRYFGNDGIHLSGSGVKRLLHAIDCKIHIVADFDLCTFKSSGSGNRRDYTSRRPDTSLVAGGRQRRFVPAANRRNQNGRSGWYHGQRGNNAYDGRSKRRCFACGMVGHLQKDCWNSV